MTSYLVWCDLEATDKDPVHARILEIALIVTTTHLKVLARHNEIIHFEKAALEPILADWSRHTHTKTGLLQECYRSSTSLAQVEEHCVQFLQPFRAPCRSGENLILAGSAIAFDMSCLRREMPRVASLFHYRTIDVNSWLLPISWWCPGWHVSRPEQSVGRHRAQSDIEDSLALMQHYYHSVLHRPPPPLFSSASSPRMMPAPDPAFTALSSSPEGSIIPPNRPFRTYASCLKSPHEEVPVHF